MSLGTDIEDTKPDGDSDRADSRRAVNETGRGESPVRRCIVTRAVRPREELIRFVAGPGGIVVPDLGAELPGRGIWASSRRDVIEKASAKNAFARSAKTQLRVPPELPDTVEGLLVSSCLRLIGLARRAGEAVGGFEKVQEWLPSGRVKFLLLAVDGSPGAKAKLRRLGRGVPVVELFDSAELGAAFGRDHVVNAAVARGGLARRLEIEIFRLSGFRSADERK